MASSDEPTSVAPPVESAAWVGDPEPIVAATPVNPFLPGQAPYAASAAPPGLLSASPSAAYPAPWGQYPPPAPRPRRGGTAILVVASVVAVVLVAIGTVAIGLVLTHRIDGMGSSVSAARSDQPMANSSPSEVPFTGDLRDILLPRPSGANESKDPISADGRLSLERAATLFDDAASARSRFQELGYRQGAVIQWYQADGLLVGIRLYQFASYDKTLAYLFADERAESHDASEIDRSPAPGIDGSGFYIAKKPDKDGDVYSVVLAAKRDIVMVVQVWQPMTVIESAVIGLAQRQVAQLP